MAQQTEWKTHTQQVKTNNQAEVWSLLCEGKTFLTEEINQGISV